MLLPSVGWDEGDTSPLKHDCIVVLMSFFCRAELRCFIAPLKIM